VWQRWEVHNFDPGGQEEMSTESIPNTNEIKMFMHCQLCADEFENHEHPGESMRTFTKYEVGYTKQGLQVWCIRHEKNVMHIDFEGYQHPANMTRYLEPGT